MVLRRALVVSLVFATLVACQDQSVDTSADRGRDVSVQPSGPCDARGDLTKKDDVLCNLEFAYRYRDLAELTRLMDPAFVFYFSPEDVGGNIPSQWDRASELLATDKMFGSPVTGIRNLSSSASAPSPVDVQEATWGFIKAAFQNANEPAVSISLSLTYDIGEDTWLAFPPFYLKYAYYSIVVVAGDDTFVSAPGRQALFTVHLAEVNGESIWQLVEWRDLP
jgi:hypothetical protein